MDNLDPAKNPEDWLEESLVDSKAVAAEKTGAKPKSGLRLNKDILAALEEVRIKEEEARKEKEAKEAEAREAAEEEAKAKEKEAKEKEVKAEKKVEDEKMEIEDDLPLGDDEELQLPSDLFGDDLFKSIMDDPSGAGDLGDIDDSALEDAEKADAEDNKAEVDDEDSKVSNELEMALNDTLGPNFKMDTKDMEDLFSGMLADEIKTETTDGTANEATPSNVAEVVDGIKNEPTGSMMPQGAEGMDTQTQPEQPQADQQAQLPPQQQQQQLQPPRLEPQVQPPQQVPQAQMQPQVQPQIQPQLQPQQMQPQQVQPQMQQPQMQQPNIQQPPQLMQQQQVSMADPVTSTVMFSQPQPTMMVASRPLMQPTQIQGPQPPHPQQNIISPGIITDQRMISPNDQQQHLLQQQQRQQQQQQHQQQQQQLQMQREQQLMQVRAQMGQRPQMIRMQHGPQGPMGQTQMTPVLLRQQQPQQFAQGPMRFQAAPAPPGATPFHQTDYQTPAALQQQVRLIFSFKIINRIFQVMEL